MELIPIYWLAGAVVVGILAGSRGRHPWGYGALSVAISPVLALALVFGLPRLARAIDVRCPHCRELVRRDATRCRHCHGELTI